MIDIPDTQIQTAFSAEENDIDIIIMGSGSCVNPSRMFWYTCLLYTSPSPRDRG